MMHSVGRSMGHRVCSSGPHLVSSTTSVVTSARQTPWCPHRSSSTPSSMRVRMARTETVFLEKGWEAAEFSLPDPSQGNQMVSLRKDVVKPDTKATVVMILCNHCPFVVHLKEAIIDVFEEYSPKGVAFVGISANSIVTHPQDGPEEMAKQGYPFPYVFDETQEVAKAYNAACTPEFIIFDADLKLAYHGQFDSSRPSKYGESPPVTGEDVRRALDCILQGKEVPQPWRPSIGCNVKWNPGSEPAWYGAQ